MKAHRVCVETVNQTCVKNNRSARRTRRPFGGWPRVLAPSLPSSSNHSSSLASSSAAAANAFSFSASSFSTHSMPFVSPPAPPSPARAHQLAREEQVVLGLLRSSSTARNSSSVAFFVCLRCVRHLPFQCAAWPKSGARFVAFSACDTHSTNFFVASAPSSFEPAPRRLGEAEDQARGRFPFVAVVKAFSYDSLALSNLTSRGGGVPAPPTP